MYTIERCGREISLTSNGGSKIFFKKSEKKGGPLRVNIVGKEIKLNREQQEALLHYFLNL